MNWRIVDKSKTKQPSIGKYSKWKEILAKEGYNQCVYCSTKDHRLGGIRHFHVEHYKPKSKFPKLENTITNLFYACPICNVFKGNDWFVLTGNLSDKQYPNPSIYNYDNLFSIKPNGVIEGKNKCGKYIINKLALNRRQLLIDRKFTMLLKGYGSLKDEYHEIVHALINESSEEAKVILRKLIDAYQKVINKKDIMFESSPYDITDTKK